MDRCKFIFDECIGLPFYNKIIPILSLHAKKSEFKHVITEYFSGIKDPSWLEKLSNEWTIITSDGGKNSKSKDKLPKICLQKKISVIILTPKIQQKRNFYKAQIIISLWEEILATTNSPPGSQFRIKSNGENRSPSLEKIKK